MRIDEITTSMFEAAVRAGATVILPLGATEAHGPHLPLGTDTFQPEYVASELSRLLGDRVLVAPTVPYGQHSTTRNMPGTIGITFDTLRSLMKDILDSIVRNGIRRIIVMSGHAGSAHMTAVNEACKETVRGNPDVTIYMFSDFYVAERCEAAGDVRGDGHGGHIETSRMLHIRPDLVTSERPSGKYRDFGYRVVGDGSMRMPQGVVGVTENASAETGKEINEFIIREVARMIE